MSRKVWKLASLRSLVASYVTLLVLLILGLARRYCDHSLPLPLLLPLLQVLLLSHESVGNLRKQSSRRLFEATGCHTLLGKQWSYERNVSVPL